MNQAKIFWDRENYVQVEKLFRQSAELCGEADVWRLNVAHTLFMQENKFREATSFYEPLVKQNYDNVRKIFKICIMQETPPVISNSTWFFLFADLER